MNEANLGLDCGDPSSDAFLEGNVFDLLGASEAPGHRGTELIGHRVGRYKLEELVGEGGFGSVYRATYLNPLTQSIQNVAVKILYRMGQSLEGLKRETTALRDLQQENIVGYLDAGVTDNGLPYLVMQWINGESIDRFHSTRNETWRVKVGQIVTACRAVEHAHSRGILHCDIKPQNILVDDERRVWLTDFGLARSIETQSSGLSSHQALRGTLAYMAPEQVASGDDRKVEVSVRSDLFALAASLFQLLSGQRPRNGTDFQVIASMVRKEPIGGVTKSVLRCPSRLIFVLQKALHVESGKRYLHVSDFREDLENVLDDRIVNARRAGVWEKLFVHARRQPALASLVCVTIILLFSISMLAVAAWRKSSAENQRISRQFQTARGFERLLASVNPEERLNPEDRKSFLKLVSESYYQLMLANPSSQDLIYKFAQSEFNLANYLDELGDFKEALEHVESAESYFEQLLKEGHRPRVVRFDLFHTFNRRASIEFHLMRPDAAKKSIVVARRYITALTSDFPEDLEFRGCLANTLYYQAYRELDTADPDFLAKQFFRVKQLAKLNREAPGALPRQWKHGGMACSALGKLAMREANYDAAIACFREGMNWSESILATLPSDHVDKWSHLLEYVGHHSGVASALRIQGRLEEAIVELDKARPMLRWVLENRGETGHAKQMSNWLERLEKKIEADLVERR
ncbi:MAG: serine/threonine-protein kinase [Planctomycetota bacterium]